jgi:hypothetical protein
MDNIKNYQAYFFMAYFDFITNYQHEHLQVFCDVVDNNCATITHDWIINLNIGTKTIAFHMASHSY